MIELIYGPVRSGKTTLLMHRVERGSLAGKRCLVVKHTIDIRYEELSKDGITTNALRSYTKGFDVVKVSTIAEMADKVCDYDIIGITESQFFEDIEMVAELADKHEVRFICEGLDGCFGRNTFGSMYKLLPRCDKVKKLNAICYSCGADAPFSSKFTCVDSTDSVIDVGGADKYAPLCRKCYLQFKIERR